MSTGSKVIARTDKHTHTHKNTNTHTQTHRHDENITSTAYAGELGILFHNPVQKVRTIQYRFT